MGFQDMKSCVLNSVSAECLFDTKVIGADDKPLRMQQFVPQAIKNSLSLKYEYRKFKLSLVDLLGKKLKKKIFNESER